MKIKRFDKLVWNLYDNVEYVAHIKTSKQALNHGLVHREIQFNQEEWLKSYTEMNTKLRTETKKKVVLRNILSS